MTRHLAEDVRREQILEAARAAFVETGFVPTRMEDIARRAGLSKGGVYFHFSSKQELFDALVQQEYDASIGMLEQVGRDEGPVAQKLETLARFYLGRLGDNSVSSRFFVVMNAVAIRDPQVRSRLQSMHETFVGAIEAVIKEGIARGEVRPVDMNSVATLLKAIVNGLEVAVAMGYNPNLGRVAQSSLEVLLLGLAPR